MVAITVPSVPTRIQQILLITARHFLIPIQNQKNPVWCTPQSNIRLSEFSVNRGEINIFSTGACIGISCVA